MTDSHSLRLSRRVARVPLTLIAAAALCGPTIAPRPLPAAPDSRPAVLPAATEVEAPGDTERVTAGLRKASAEAEAQLAAATAEHDKLDMDPSSDPGAKADSTTRLRAAILRAREASALVKAAAVEPYIPADQRAKLRALPPAERLAVLAARPADEALRVVLPEVKFEKVTLAEALNFFRDAAPVNLHVDWRALEAAGVDQTAPINLHVRNAPLRETLSSVLRAAKADAPLQIGTLDNVAMVTTAQSLSLADKVAARLDAAAAADPKLKAALDRRLAEVKTDTAGVSDMIDFCRDVAGCNIYADWPRLDDNGIDRNAPVTFHLDRPRLGDVLQLLACGLGGVKGQPLAALSADEGVILMAPPDALDAMAAARKRLDELTAGDEQAKALFTKRVPELKAERAGFKDVCDLLKNLTGAPVEADWEGLAIAKCPPDEPISLFLHDVSAGEAFLRVMDAAAGEKGTPRVGFENGRVVVRVPEK